MILHKIGVSHWRSLLDEVTLGPFSEQLNVIHAPNGTGKSSLFEAMRRALFDAHNVSGTDIAAVRPWGRDLSPSVFVEFSENGATYRVEKTFLSGASAKLLQLENGKFQPLADSRNADSRIREILSADAPGRGLSKQEHWGLAQILWAPQGDLQLQSISGSAAERLRSALGVQISGDSGGRLEDLIKERFQTYFTPSGTGYRKGKNAAPIISLQERRDAAQSALATLREKQEAFEEASHRVEDARHRRSQAKNEAEALRDTVKRSRAEAERFEKLQSEKKLKREAEALAKQRYETISETIEQIAKAREEIASLTQAIEKASQRQNELEEEVANAKKKLETCRSSRETARGKRSRSAELQKKIEAARDYLSCRSNSDDLAKRLDKLGELQKNLAALKKQRSEIVAPDAETISDLRKWLGKRDAAKAALAASQIHLTLTPEQPIEVRNLTDDSKARADSVKPLTLSGDELVEIEVTGFGRIRASGPEGGAEEHRQAIAKAEASIDKLSQPFGQSDPDALQLLREKAEQSNRDIKNLNTQIFDILGADTADQLAQKQNELSARLSGFETTYPDWKNQSPVVSELQTRFETLNDEITSEIQKAEDAFDTQQTALATAEKQLGELSAQLKADQRSHQSAEERLQALSKDKLTDPEREKAKSDALMEWQAAKQKADEAETELASIPGDPSKDLEKLEKQRTALEESEEKARDEEKTAEGQLQVLAAEGTYSKLTQCEEELADLEERILRENVRTEAVRLLHDTLAACKSAVIASIAAPVERAASRMLSRVVGPRLGNLRLTQDFVPEAVAPERSESPVAITNLSGGEQEQLFLAARLALATVLAKDQRQLVVLDDVLNATDSGRHARILNLLEESSDHLQIIILTCHPERYRALDTAEYFELR
ncbi:hypothetical protein IEN85_19295 [Pelagicoccus sp. NFK12]|uniref:Rad50/SbcC-type AAA domain-containing protein n=1 Tax=Pelagicoccus enzymogenes TaxID=2773457 RepID=A0A927FDF1_9BACT|nr:hypothetical protein [Pelagicoccus enzymogenes]MBD5781655.1 hypothetical protein [Pelagicoccus enzymogenes]